MDSTDIILVRRISRAEWDRMPWPVRQKLQRSGYIRRPTADDAETVQVPVKANRRPRVTDAAISRCGRCGSWMLTECKVHHGSESD